MKIMLSALAAFLAAVVVAAAAFVALVWTVQRGVMFPAPGPPSFDVTGGVVGVEKLRVGANGDVDAWLMPPTVGDAPYPVLIFGHGNGELIDHWVDDFQTPRGWGFGVLLVEFPGYGRSGGPPTETTVTDAFVGAYDLLAARPDVLASGIVGYGRSLGGGAICRLAARRSLAAIVLESTFSSVRPLAARMGVPGWLVRDPFDNLAVLRTYADRFFSSTGRAMA